MPHLSYTQDYALSFLSFVFSVQPVNVSRTVYTDAHCHREKEKKERKDERYHNEQEKNGTKIT